MLEAFVVINLLYWFVWRPISFIMRWLISKDEVYQNALKEEAKEQEDRFS